MCRGIWGSFGPCKVRLWALGVARFVRHCRVVELEGLVACAHTQRERGLRGCSWVLLDPAITALTTLWNLGGLVGLEVPMNLQVGVLGLSLAPPPPPPKKNAQEPKSRV